MTNHLSDGQLFQLIDAPGHQEAETRAHADSCAECGSRLVALQQRTRRFGELLRLTDETVPLLGLPGARYIGRRLAIAATLTLLLTGSLFVQPVRAWILMQGRALWGRVATDVGSVESEMTIPPIDGNGTAAVSFVPRHATLRIDVTVAQVSGTVFVRRVGGGEVTANVKDAGEADGIAVLPDGFRIENSEQSVARYDVAVPSTIEMVEVVVAGKLVARFDTGPQFSIRNVDLTAEPRT